MRQYSPLRYPGGKGKLAPYVKSLILRNNLSDGTYVEPYAGGAGVALALLLEGHMWTAVINDIDPHIYAFWYALLNHTDEFVQKLTDTPVTVEQWREQKAIYKNAGEHSVLEQGFSTFYLNRTNRSGILRAGVIGGYAQSGNYRIDARFNKKNLISRIEKIALYRSRIKLYNLDALQLIDEIAPTLSQKSLIYFDPPYYNKADMLYRNFYRHEDHVDVANKIKTINTPWMVTYDNEDEIHQCYSGEKSEEFSICYTAHNKRPRMKEVLFYKNLILPQKPWTSKKELLKLQLSLVS